MKRFCIFLIVTGGALWWLCDVGLLLEHPVFFTVFFALSLSLSLSAVLHVFDLCCTVEGLEKRIQKLEGQEARERGNTASTRLERQEKELS